MDLLAPHAMDEVMRELEAQTSKAWVALASTGDPNHPGLPRWPAYTDAEKAVMLFDSPCRVVNDPGAVLRKALLPEAASRSRGPFGGPS